ncbi:MAG: DUF6688 family protein [Waltera sp.]
MLRWCDNILRKAAWWTGAGTGIDVPTTVGNPDRNSSCCLDRHRILRIKAFTETSDWNLSLRQAPQNVMYDGHIISAR